jgi:hypothetical protein
MFIVKNKDSFKINSDIHSFNTRPNHDLQIPVANLAVFTKDYGILVLKFITIWQYGILVLKFITIWQYGILVLKFITISHQLLNNYHVMFLNLKRL